MDLLIIGTASLDLLHLPDKKLISTAGGAGMYTALAAHKTGARVALFAPRPTLIPEPLQLIAQRVPWFGPIVPPDELPRLEITHHGGGRATLVDASWGAEARLLPKELPTMLGHYHAIHIAALSSAQRQLDFLHACRQRGAKRISVGTYARAVHGETANVRQLLAEADLFFMNENEANGLFGGVGDITRWKSAPDKLLFVTQSERGAWIIQGEKATHVPTTPVQEVDPTGAGDTFCGATLAGLAQGRDVVTAASRAAQLATAMVGRGGSEKLL